MLKIGMDVIHVSGSHRGRLEDIDGSTGYVLQSNGVEIEFPLAQLVAKNAPEQLLPRIPPVLLDGAAQLYTRYAPSDIDAPAWGALPDSIKLKLFLSLFNLDEAELPALLTSPAALAKRCTEALRSLS